MENWIEKNLDELISFFPRVFDVCLGRHKRFVKMVDENSIVATRFLVLSIGVYSFGIFVLGDFNNSDIALTISATSFVIFLFLIQSIVGIEVACLFVGVVRYRGYSLRISCYFVGALLVASSVLALLIYGSDEAAFQIAMSAPPDDPYYEWPFEISYWFKYLLKAAFLAACITISWCYYGAIFRLYKIRGWRGLLSFCSVHLAITAFMLFPLIAAASFGARALGTDLMNLFVNNQNGPYMNPLTY